MPLVVGPVGLTVLGAVVGTVTSMLATQVLFSEESFARQHPIMFLAAIVALAKIILEQDKEHVSPREYPL
jgi:hypothetical protein